MARVKINVNKEINGRVSIVRILDKSEDRPKMMMSGQLATHKYFDDIFQIETDRYILKGVEIVQENFGSEDFDIIYTFTAKDLEIKGGESQLKKNEIDMIEAKLYNAKGDVIRE